MTTDIALDAPALTNRAILERARGKLAVVVTYGLGGIQDKIDREHIVAAHMLLSMVLDADAKTNQTQQWRIT